MTKTFRSILQCIIIMLFSQTMSAKSVHVAMRSVHQEFAKNINDQQALSCVMYEVGKYPGKHKFFIHKKVVNPFSAFTISETWTVPIRVPVSDIHYSSPLYRSHISAILNSNDLLRGPPATVA